MSKPGSKRVSQALSALALASALAWPTGATAASGYHLRKVALEGEAAPGTSVAFADLLESWSSVDVNAAGQVALVAMLAGGPPDGGLWVDTGGALALRMRSGDTAPGTGGATYVLLAGPPQLDAAGGVAVLAAVSGGSRGLFLDAAGVDSALLLPGTPAPPGVGGTLDASLSDLQPFDRNASGTLVFRSQVSGGGASAGVFLRDAGGTLTAAALAGDAAPDAGGATFEAFHYPALAADARVAFAAKLSGGPELGALFADTGAGTELLALAGDTAPGTGGGSFANFLYPAISADAVAFLAGVSGASTTGGLFLAQGGIVPVALELGSAPGTGGATFASLNAQPAIDEAGRVVASFTLAGGSVDGGVFVYDADTAQLAPAVLAGDAVPGVTSTLAAFGHVAVSHGAIAFVAQLADGRGGVFVATPAVEVPALSSGPALLATLLLGLAARGALRRRARARRA